MKEEKKKKEKYGAQFDHEAAVSRREKGLHG